MQKMLLRQEERQLFEDFLLQEIAEAIRTHILEGRRMGTAGQWGTQRTAYDR